MKTILAPLRGVTIRTFREVFAPQLAEAGFDGAVAPFIPAIAPKVNAKLLKDVMRQLGEPVNEGKVATGVMPLVPQAIGKDPAALRELLKAFRDLGFEYADLNSGCPFPMIRNKGRGSGLLKTPDTLARMLEAGVETMGEGKFSLKVRLGVDSTGELIKLMPVINQFPLAMLTIHARTAKQMYTGTVDVERFRECVAASTNPIIYNGDITVSGDDKPILTLPKGVEGDQVAGLMIGRGFVGYLGTRRDSRQLLAKFVEANEVELCGRGAVLGRVKELLSYWRDYSPFWRRKWESIKLCRTIDELRMVVG